MKKIMILFFALIFIFNAKDVFAQDQYKLTLEKQDGIYMTRRGSSYGYDSYPFYIYKMNGLFAYCIEPGKHITTYTYVGGEEYVDLGFSDELKEKLELIGYYGRDYPGHDNVYYSMAAQALIWELTGVDSVTFWTKQYEGGEEINIENERNEIMRLVNNHKTLPNFKDSYSVDLKREITINDTNKVLNNYDVISSGEQEVFIDNNALHIIPKKIGSYTISLKRKSYEEYKTIIFVGKSDSSSQKLGRLHFNKEIKKDINIKVNGIRISLHKIDEKGEPIKISNIYFKIKNINTGEYMCEGVSSCIYATDTNGIFISEPLDYGEYEIEEIENQLVQGYTWNSEKMKISLDENTELLYSSNQYNYIDVYFVNNSVPISVEINKTGEKAIFNNNEITYSIDKLSNIYFDVYTIDDKYVTTAVTDNNGIAMVNNLKIGKYYLMERTESNEYIEKDKFVFSLRQISQYQTTIVYHFNIKNELKKGNLEFSKIDSKTNKGIANTIVEIYNEHDVLLFTKETDSNGKIFIENLPVGKYYIKEKESNYYYEKTLEVVNFEIKENGETVKSVMKNNKIVGKVEIEKYGEEMVINDNDLGYQGKPLANIEFELFNENNELVDVLKTNDFGYAKRELELGKYYLIEKTKIANYKENNERYDFEIKKDNNKAIDVKLRINNNLKKGSLEFCKTDLATSEGIPNTIIEIYDEEDMLLLTKETDENGLVIINDLPLGKYYIIEKVANTLYLITNEKIYFEIKDNGEIVKANMVNEKKEIPVPKTNTKEKIIANSIFGISFLIGIGRMYYERKESY